MFGDHSTSIGWAGFVVEDQSNVHGQLICPRNADAGHSVGRRVSTVRLIYFGTYGPLTSPQPQPGIGADLPIGFFSDVELITAIREPHSR